MYKKYKNIKKYSKTNKVIKPPALVALLLVLLLFMSIGYSYWTTSLKIGGRVTAKSLELPIKIYLRNIEDTETIRYSTDTGFTIDTKEIYQIAEEKYEGNRLVTTIKKVNNLEIDENIRTNLTLPIHNITNKDFNNGKIKLIDKNDSNGIFNNINYSLSSEMIIAGGQTNININGNLKVNGDVSTNTFYKFEITYDIQGETYYFYYNLIIS